VITETSRELVDWLRTETPETIAQATIAKLQSGVTMDELWAAGALTAARYVSNQARNLLGFVSHAMIGCEDARQSAAGQPQDVQTLMLIQALSQVVVDLRDPCFAPYELFDLWGIEEDTPEEGIQQLRNDVKFGEWMRADHRLVGLERSLPREELVDLLLDIGLEGIVTDDHTVITPALSMDMMEITGWELGFPMLRGTMRYSCTFPRDLGPYTHASELVEKYDLARHVNTTGFQADLVETLRAEIANAEPKNRPEVVAQILHTGDVSPETMMSALSLAACDMYLRVDPVPQDDFDAVSREVAPIHLGTTLNILRSSLHRMSQETKAKALVMGGCLLQRGPSVLNEDFEFVPFEPSRAYPYAEDVEALAGEEPSGLLGTLESALYAHDVRTTTAAVAAYHQAGGDAEELIGLLVRVACTDDGTLMHNVKHLHSCLGEFRSSSHPDRWNFLIAAAKWVSWYAGKDTSTYQRAQSVLAT